MKSLRISAKITNREANSFKLYLNEIANIEMFTPDEETECALKASLGDKKAIDELCRRNLRFVVSVAKQYESSTAPLQDLINEGNLGLYMAASQYNPSAGFKFITYAVWWIRKMILEFLAKNGRIVRLPSNKIIGLNKYNQHVARLEQKHGGSVDNLQIANELSGLMSIDEITELQNISSINFESLDTMLNDVDGGSLYDVIPDDGINPTDHIITNEDLKLQISRAMKVLKPRDRKIMTMLFGLDGGTPMTLKEVGDRVDLTREMVRQIREKCLKQLHKSFKF